MVSSDLDALGFLGPAGKEAVLDVARQPDAAGHDDPVMRPFAAGRFGGWSEKLVNVHCIRRRAHCWRATLFDFVAQTGGFLEVFLFNGFGQAFSEGFSNDRKRPGFCGRIPAPLPTWRVPLCMDLSKPSSASAKVL